MKRILTFIIALVISVLGLNAQNFDVIDSELQMMLSQKSNEPISINIILDSQFDADKLNNIDNKSEKREYVISELKKFSSENQNKVMAYLQAEEGNNVTNLKSHWLVNTISCTATRDVIYKTSELSGISLIAHNGKEKLIGDYKPMKAQKQRGLIQNVTTVGADQVWAEGYTGKDVIVAVLDSGVNSEHVDLKDHLWDGGSEYPDHGWNFIDNNSNTNDYNGHGTHCAGTICGDGTSGTQTGMAPDATLMCVKVLDDDGRGTLEALVSGIEFAVENGADILSISLGWTYPNSYVSGIMREMFENVMYAGVVASVAAGNERDGIDTIPIPYNINAPGNCPPPWLHPDQQTNAGGLSAVVSVGAVDYYDQPAYFSSEGPVTWQGSQWHDYLLNIDVEIDENWLHYDNGIFETSIGGPELFYWGVMFPASALQQHSGDMLSKISVYDYIADTLELLVYYGGDYAPEVLVHTQTFELTGSNSVVEIDLTSSLPIDRNENLWIVLFSNNGTDYPAAACSNTGNPNGRWISMDGTTWEDIVDYGLEFTWMIRAYVSDESGSAVAELKSIDDYEYKSSKGKLSALKADSKRAGAASNDSNFGLIRPDVSAPGVDIVSAAYDDNYGFYSYSGTSMATPCVAGVMALMLDKNPDLTPADICRILETTATPLDYKKSNRTGSGRINAYEACEMIEEENEEIPSGKSFFTFESGLDGWTTIDADNDGHNWFNSSEVMIGYHGYNESNCVMSQSYDNEVGVLYPDNYLVSPEKYLIDNSSKIKFMAAAQDPSWAAEHFGVAVSTASNNNANDFTTVAEWTMTSGAKGNQNSQARGFEAKAEGTWFQYEVDLSQYAGQEVWLAIRHFNCSDQWILCVDNVEIVSSDEDDALIPIRTVQRIPMIEHFSSSTCMPCVNVNNLMDVLTSNNQGKYTYTKYPMNWPGTGDPYYTGEGGTRMSFYDVTGTPQIFLDGTNQYHGAISQAVFDEYYNNSSYVDIRGSFDVVGNTINVIADFMSYVDIDNVDAYISINEKTTTGNIGGNGETEFHHIMLKLSSNAIDIEAGKHERIEYSYNMSNTFMEDISDLEVALWLQNPETKEIYNSRYAYEYTKHPYPVVDVTINDYVVSWNSHADANPVSYDIYIDNVLVENTTNKYYELNVPNAEYVEIVALYGNNKTSVGVVSSLASLPSETIPAAPQNLVAEAISSSEIQLSWDDVDGAEHYNVYYGDALLGYIATPACVVSVVEYGTYCFTVTAVNEVGESEHSNEACATVEESEKPNQPEYKYRISSVYAEDGMQIWDYNYSDVIGTSMLSINKFDYTYGGLVETKDSLYYDANGNITKIATWQNFDGEWSYVCYVEYTYNEQNLRATRKNYNNFDNTMELGGTYYYNYDVNGKMTDWRLEFFDFEEYQKGVIEYNEAGQKVSETIQQYDFETYYLRNNQLIEYEYDGYGNLVNEVEYYYSELDERVPSIYKHYDYDDFGNCIQFEQTTASGQVQERRVYTYDTSVLAENIFYYSNPEKDFPALHQMNNMLKSFEYYAENDNGELVYVIDYIFDYEAIEESGSDIPAAPTNLVAEAISSSEIQLSWDAVDGAEYYNVYLEYEYIGYIAATACVVNVVEYGTHCFTVTAVNEVGESEHSNEACATVELPYYWTPDPSLYANNMTVISTIAIDGVEQSDFNLELGAFCGDEVRGSGKLQYVGSPANRYECFLMVYGNAGDNITFKLYDHATETVSDLKTNQSVTFEVNGAVGDVIDPYAINFTSTIVHNQELKSGWNWYSTYVVNEGAEGLANLENAVGTNGIQIKNQSKFVNQAGGNWYGTLEETSVEDMFMIQLSSATNVTLEGYEVNPAEHPITLGTNWKWISYPLSTEMSVEEAFASANPSNGDYVKSQTGFAQYYDGLGWSGTLKTMTPGLGYMYQNKSGYAKTLVYPSSSSKGSVKSNVTTDNNHWTADYSKYPMNMTMIAVVEGAESAYEVAAFADGECRGSARPIYVEALDSYIMFMTISGEDGETLTFKYYDVNTGETYAIADEFTFSVNATVGDVMNPYVMTRGALGIDELSSSINIYPNPVDNELFLATEVRVEEIAIYDVYGRKTTVYGLQTTDFVHSIDVADLEAGVYFVNIKTENGNIVKRFVKK